LPRRFASRRCPPARRGSARDGRGSPGDHARRASRRRGVLRRSRAGRCMIEPILFSRPFDLGTLPRQRGPIRIEADAAERQAIAGEFDLLALDSLVAEFEITPGPGDTFELRGRLRSSLVQSCVISLAPVPQEIDESIAIDLVPAGAPLAEM